MKNFLKQRDLTLNGTTLEAREAINYDHRIIEAEKRSFRLSTKCKLI